jgi:predicted CXXCH cytochrome family protein
VTSLQLAALFLAPAGFVALAGNAAFAGADGSGRGEPVLCARCHDAQAALAVATGGHAAGLDCIDCHADRRPGIYGRRHRATSRCGTHHDEVRHPPAARAGAPLRPRRNCLVCHDVHGSPNAHLVRRLLPLRGDRFAEVRFDNEAGAAPGGFTDPTAPGTGLCEVCHKKTDFYRADGGGEPHFTDSCVLCHAHTDGFRAVVSESNCTVCHAAEGARFAKPSAHAARFACSDCHAEQASAPGPDHRAVRACADCHDHQTHMPPAQAAVPCTQCHDPHGSDNTHLVLEQIVTTSGAERPIAFDNIDGLADGSFASASNPGTGVCEVCHTQTRFYRADGSGEAHYPYSCLPCHRHAQGFAPQ